MRGKRERLETTMDVESSATLDTLIDWRGFGLIYSQPVSPPAGNQLDKMKISEMLSISAPYPIERTCCQANSTSVSTKSVTSKQTQQRVITKPRPK